jgi:uncharacterized protein YpbB
MSEYGIESNIAAIPNKKSKKAKKKTENIGEAEGENGNEKPTSKKINTKEQTWQLFKQGLSLSEIAKQRGYTLGTIEGHLIPYIANGELSVDTLVESDKQKIIMKALENFNYDEGINPVKAKLPSNISFSEIRYMIAAKIKNA